MNTPFLRTTLCAIAMATSAASCYRTRIDVGSGPIAALSTTAQQTSEDGSEYLDGKMYHSIVYGLVDLSGPLHLRQICPLGVDHIEQKTGFLAGLIASITGGLYNPVNVQVFCVDGSTAQLSAEQWTKLAKNSQE